MRKPARSKGVCHQEGLVGNGEASCYYDFMSKTPPRTVKDTGADLDDLLIGITPRNLGLVIRIHNKQERGAGGRIAGAFDIVHWGLGTYAQSILAVWHKSQSFGSVEDFIEALTSVAGSSDFTHGLNANGLWKLDAAVIADEIISSAGEE